MRLNRIPSGSRCSTQDANEAPRDLALCLPRPRLQSPSHFSSNRGITSSSEAFARRSGPRGPAPGPLRPSFGALGPAQRPSSNRPVAGSSRGYNGGSCVYPHALLDPTFGGEAPLPRTSRDRGAVGFGMRRDGAFYQPGRGQHRGSQGRTGFQARPAYHNPFQSLTPDPSIPDWVRSLNTSHFLASDLQSECSAA